jgi:2-succinyl-5-enolpyruvyl-6-hydroxy-3-cyclohexene-1-carboxylate synthase
MSTPGDTAATFCATLVDEWLSLGISHAVIAPGSRSTPLAVQLAQRPEFSVHLFHDERSASFAALGIGEATGVPAILLCTSGTAATHFHGAVVEAHQANVPMIVCTGDRPPELRDVGAPQTINQTNLFGSAVRWFHDPGVPSDDASHTWRSLAARTVSLACGERPGPVHLNLPFREPLLGTTSALPAGRRDGWSVVSAARSVSNNLVSSFAADISGKRGIFIAGRGASPSVLALAQQMGWPVFADPRSGLRVCEPNVVVAFDPILRHSAFADSHVPDVVVRVGDPPASKVTAQWISRHAMQVVQVQSTSMVIDPDHATYRTYVAPVDELMTAVQANVAGADASWVAEWNAAETVAQNAISSWTQKEWSEPTVARVVTDSLDAASHLVVSSSMPIRDVEWFGTVTPNVLVHSNRGTNGIDGVTSTAVGVALGSQSPVTVLIGDVACLHDSNGLWGLAQRNVNMKIVVTNNDGGAIFSFLPQATQVDNSTFELLYGTPHGASFEHLAATHGLRYEKATDRASLLTALQSQGTCLIEVPLKRAVNVGQHDALNASVVEAVSTVL